MFLTIKRLCLIPVLLLSGAFAALGGEKKIYNGFDGGVLFNTGCYWVHLSQNEVAGSYTGCPLGVGGFGRAHLGEHFLLGGSGYLNTATISSTGNRNGSETIHAFGGLLAQVYGTYGIWRPYAGFLVGGGILKNNVMQSDMKEASGSFVPSYSNKSFVWSCDPMAGVQVKLFGRVHLMVQLSYTVPFNRYFYEQFHGFGAHVGLVFSD